jgi:hypothetical protein
LCASIFFAISAFSSSQGFGPWPQTDTEANNKTAIVINGFILQLLRWDVGKSFYYDSMNGNLPLTVSQCNGRRCDSGQAQTWQS